MLIGDGVTPGNEGRGYVLRRMLRRAVRSMRLLGYDDPALPHLLPISMERMKQSYPELETGFDRISQIAYAEEEAFRRTLASGTTILDTAVSRTKESGGTTLAGDQAFQLHDTYGFPIDLTLEMAEEQGLSVDREGFTRLMQEQRDRAKADAKSKKSGHANTEVWKDLRARRRDRLPRLAGADERGHRRRPRHRRPSASRRSSPASAARSSSTAPRSTPSPAARSPTRASSPPTASTSRSSTCSARSRASSPTPSRSSTARCAPGAPVLAEVDPEWRLSACQAHSGTHVVHAALRQVLGPSALQSGSYNKPGYLRLDFAWGQALSPETRSEIEEVANLAVRRDLPVSATWMSLEQAREAGALALFGETYGEDVRVVEIGGPWSRELCGGTHVGHSSQVGAITMTGEFSVGSGVRRLEAFVGMDALRHLARERAIVAELSGIVGAQPGELTDRVPAMVTRLKDAERELEKSRKQAVLAAAGSLTDSAQGRRRGALRRSRRRGDGRRRRRPRHGARRPPAPRRRRALRGRRHRRRQGPARRRHRDQPGRARQGASGPASSSASPRRPSAVAAAARTTSPRAAARTSPGPARRSTPSSGAWESWPVERPPRGAGGGRRRHGACRRGRQRPLGDARDAARDARPTLAGRRTGRTDDSSEIVALSGERDALEVVVGLPRSLDGTEGPAARAARTYAAELARRLAPVGVRLVDERLTSVDAHRTLRESGVSGRRQRAVVDQAAAVLILQAALDEERSAGRPPGEPVTTTAQAEDEGRTTVSHEHLDTTLFGEPRAAGAAPWPSAAPEAQQGPQPPRARSSPSCSSAAPPPPRSSCSSRSSPSVFGAASTEAEDFPGPGEGEVPVTVKQGDTGESIATTLKTPASSRRGRPTSTRRPPTRRAAPGSSPAPTR